MARTCHCELCGGASEQDQSLAFAKLRDALSLVRTANELSEIERGELARAEIAALDAGLEHPVPAVIFPAPSPLRRLKAGFTYRYLMNSELEDIAESIYGSVVEGLAKSVSEDAP